MTKKQTVWRVQNEFGAGPYRGRGNIGATLSGIFRAGRIRKDRWRTPLKDETLKEKFNGSAGPDPNAACAFKDLEQYRRWFHTRELRDLLHYAGFFLAKYEVETSVLHGATQSLFLPEGAKLVAVRACNDPGIAPVETAKLKAAKRFAKQARQKT